MSSVQQWAVWPPAGLHAAVLASRLHDLRQPLCALRLYGQAISMALQDADAQLQSLATGWMQALLDFDELSVNLLDLAWADSACVPLKPRLLQLHDVFERVRRHLEPEALEKGLLLRFRGGQRKVWADPVVLERLLRNLVGNAIRSTTDGGIIVGARSRAGALLLQVWDSGVGLSPQQLAAVHRMALQAQAHAEPGAAVMPVRATPMDKGPIHAVPVDTLQVERGHGLGLSIVAQLSALMSARLHVRSVPGRGSVFSITMPGHDDPLRSAPVLKAGA